MKDIAQIVGLNHLLKIVAEYADSIPGKEFILSLKPTHPEEKEQQTFDYLSQVIGNQSLIPNLSIIENKGKPEIGVFLSTKDLLHHARMLEIVAEMKEILEENKFLIELEEQLVELPELQKEIEKSIDEEGLIRDDATPLLKSLIRQRKNLQSQIDERLKEIMADRGELLQDTIVTQRSGRTVIPVKYERRGEIEGLVVDLSKSGNTAFVEPGELIPMNNRFREIEIEIEEEKKRILKYLTDRLRKEFNSIKRNIETLAIIDSLRARARYLQDFKCIIPEFSDECILELKKCRHPLLMVDREVVPLDLSLGEENRTLLVSGPNAGGKTVLLKAIGINVLAAYSGLPIPAAEGTIIGKFKNLYGIIEDEQSLEENLSSFSSYVIRFKRILEKADEFSLVLCDELGGNTDPEEGSALATAILNTLTERGCLIIATTHLSALKFYVAEHEGMQNAAMEYIDGPTYHLQPGLPGGSRAIAVAESLGLPIEVITRAKEFLDSSVLKAEDLIEELARRTKKIKEREREIEELRTKLHRSVMEYNEKMGNLKQERKHLIQESEEKAREIIADARSTVEKTIRDIKESKAATESIKDYKKAFDFFLGEQEEEKRKTTKLKTEKSPIRYEVDTDVPLEISIRGITKEEAWEELDKYLDRAVLAGYDHIRIVHGKGSWILRNMTHEKLKKDPRVTSISTPPPREGGGGVTIAKLK